MLLITIFLWWVTWSHSARIKFSAEARIIGSQRPTLSVNIPHESISHPRIELFRRSSTPENPSQIHDLFTRSQDKYSLTVNQDINSVLGNKDTRGKKLVALTNVLYRTRTTNVNTLNLAMDKYGPEIITPEKYIEYLDRIETFIPRFPAGYDHLSRKGLTARLPITKPPPEESKWLEELQSFTNSRLVELASVYKSPPELHPGYSKAEIVEDAQRQLEKAVAINARRAIILGRKQDHDVVGQIRNYSFEIPGEFTGKVTLIQTFPLE